MVRFRMLVVVSVLVVALVCTTQAALAAGWAQDPAQPPDVPSLVEALTLLAQGLGTGAVLAFLFERFKWFQNQTPTFRWWFIFGMSLGLPLLAQVALQFVPENVWAVLEPYWRALALGFVSWAGAQGAHLLQKAVETRRVRVIGQ